MASPVRSLQSQTVSQRVDVVISHVDGSAPGFEALCRQHTGEFVPCQMRALGELRFVLRSIEKYASWANIVLVVQSGDQVPTWLNRQSVRIVFHGDFIPHELLPTFHFATIVAHLHLIPGLSEKYVYWADDILVGAPLHPTDLFASDDLLALNWATVPIPYGLGRFLGKYQLNLEETRRALCRLLGRKVNAFLYPHAPLPTTRESWARFHDAAIDEPNFLSTITRRSRGDERALPTIDPPTMYANWVEAKVRGRRNIARYLLATKALVMKGPFPAIAPGSSKSLRCPKYAVVNDEGRMRRHMDGLLRAGATSGSSNKVVFFNVNDEAYDSWISEGRIQDSSILNPASPRRLLETLAALFPDRSRYEMH